MNDTAAFTAEVALKQNTPGDLQIAGFQISPNKILALVKEITGETFTIHQLSGLEDFAAFINKKRAENPAGENELYAKFQQSQYMYGMFKTHHKTLANDRYQNLSWTSGLEYLKTFVK